MISSQFLERFQEFVISHPFLWAGVLAILVALAVTEALRYFRGQRPISVSQAVQLMNAKEAIVVDTRSAADYKKGHILNARHVPMAGIESRAKEITKAMDRDIVCYCASGSVAPQAVAKLRKLGYSNVHALKGGINGWQADGLPVTKK